LTQKKKNILIIGNSHARNTFNALKLNENLFNTLEFSILDLSIDCVENIFIKFEFCDEVKMTKLQKKIFNDSEVIILSTRFREVDINSLEKIIHLTRKFKKQIVLTTKSPSFYFENYLTFLDKFYIENKRLPNAEETIILEKKYFRSMNEKDKILNKRIEDISINLNVRLLKKIDLFCDKKTERCVFLTKNNDKILFDADHYSLNGAKYIGKKIFYLNWLGLN
jgi:hypothetical protein